LRAIRSYVLRQGRTTPAQQRALDELLPRYGVAFGRKISSTKPLVLEIGSGMGETTAALAQAHPEMDFVAVEVHGPGVGSLLNRIEAEKLANVRVIRHDAVEVLDRMVADASLAGIHLFFPDPWPKKRHHKRRLLQGAFAGLLAERLQPGGYLHVATDWQDYAERTLEVLEAVPALRNTAQRFAPRPPWRPETKFERRGLRLGHDVWDLLFEKVRA